MPFSDEDHEMKLEALGIKITFDSYIYIALLMLM